MKSSPFSIVVMVYALGATLIAAPALAEEPKADDAAKAAPDQYKVLLDNEYVRVLESHLSPGAKSPMHSHPAYIVYNFSPGKVRFTAPDGKTTEVEFKAGQTIWRDAESHVVENIGRTDCHVLHVELKRMGGEDQRVAQLARWRESASGAEHRMSVPADLKWESGPPSLPAGMQMAMLEGDLSKPGPFTLRAKMPAGYKIPAHWHPADEHVTVLSGVLGMGMGDQLDESKGKEFPAGGFAVMPAKSHHFAWAKEETIIQVHGIGPWGITYINPADDPRKGK